MSEEIRSAATAVIIRDHNARLEILLLRRHKQLKVGGGHWVFPGGTVDPEDHSGAVDQTVAARNAAVRETEEEASLTLDAGQLTMISHWTTPPSMGRRFATWFFIIEGDTAAVTVDGEEMDDHIWGAPSLFLARHQQRELNLLPPTVVTLTELAACDNVAQAMAFYRDRDVPYFEPMMAESDIEADICMLYCGDAGYGATDASLAGPRNRCYLHQGVWRYVSQA